MLAGFEHQAQLTIGKGSEFFALYSHDDLGFTQTEELRSCQIYGTSDSRDEAIRSIDEKLRQATKAREIERRVPK